MERRVQIIDVSHLFYKAMYGGMPPLTATLSGGEVINTTIPTFVIKAVNNWSRGGFNPTVVCFDSRGCTRCRKAYFVSSSGEEQNAYKGGRNSENNQFYDSINATMNLLYQGGVCCLVGDNYEADDLVKAAVDKAKKTFPELPIDVITGDADLVPLVDNQVSVFLTSRKTTFANSKELEKRGYVQLTPSNMQDYMEGLSEFKNLLVPYNTVLLKKLLRGDKSDGVAGYPKFFPRKYNDLITQMQADGVDLGTLCRYDAPTEVILYNDTNEPVPAGTPLDKNTMHIRFGEPPALTNLKEVLSRYLDEDIVKHVEYVYNGINLNGAFVDLPDTFKRRPAKMTSEVKGFNWGELCKSVQKLKIRLKQF